jgi:hypothetical protein
MTGVTSRFVGVEALEGRRLCSATMVPAAHVKVPIPNLVSVFQGTISYTTGASDSVTLSVTKQVGGAFVGETAQGSGSIGRLTGTVTRAGKVHFVDHGFNVKFVSTGSGTFAGNTLELTFHTVEKKQHFSGTVVLNRLVP